MKPPEYMHDNILKNSFWKGKSCRENQTTFHVKYNHSENHDSDEIITRNTTGQGNHLHRFVV
jgi:hypothetical protein